jgi:hypothetical protein
MISVYVHVYRVAEVHKDLPHQKRISKFKFRTHRLVLGHWEFHINCSVYSANHQLFACFY